MLYAILAYHVEDQISSMTPEEDSALMSDLLRMHDQLDRDGRLGPAARLAFTQGACTLREQNLVLDGPFAETKEQLLGFYVVDCETRDGAVDIAREFRRVNRTAVYEIRPISLYLPGKALPETSA